MRCYAFAIVLLLCSACHGTKSGRSLPAPRVACPAARAKTAATATGLHVSDNQACAIQQGVVVCTRFPSGEDKPVHYALASRRVKLPADFRVISIAVGGRHGCALSRGGRVACWGSNQFGVLGRNPATLKSSPEALLFPWVTDAVQLVAGHRFSCLRTARGIVRCWGDSDFGTHGRYLRLAYCNERMAKDDKATCKEADAPKTKGTKPPTEAAMSTVPLQEPASSLTAAGTFACATLAKTRRLVCWGEGFGQNHKD